jgi:putative Holliday junction resolvase
VTMRIVGLDVGDRTIGVAVSDELGWTAQGVGVVRRTRLAEDLRRLEEVLAPFPPERFVVGLPLNMNGTAGPQAEKVQVFARALGEHFHLPVETWDERLTTVAAERTLLEADVSRARRRQVIDKLAAVFILQAYLDRRQSSGT